MYAELGAYQCQVFLDLSVFSDDAAGPWSRLAHELAGRGVPSIDAALREQELRPLVDSFKTVLWLRPDAPDADADRAYASFLAAVEPHAGGRIDARAAREEYAAGGQPSASDKARRCLPARLCSHSGIPPRVEDPAAASDRFIRFLTSAVLAR